MEEYVILSELNKTEHLYGVKHEGQKKKSGGHSVAAGDCGIKFICVMEKREKSGERG